jgi:hypothetical protein
MVFRSPEDEILVKHGGEDYKITDRLQRKQYDAEAFGVTNPPQLLLFVGDERFTLGFGDDDNPEDLARRLNRWLELARESASRRGGA